MRWSKSSWAAIRPGAAERVGSSAHAGSPINVGQRTPFVIGPDGDSHPAVLSGTGVHALGSVSVIPVARRAELDPLRAAHYEFADLLHQVLQLA